jgi:hypothetical protein
MGAYPPTERVQSNQSGGMHAGPSRVQSSPRESNRFLALFEQCTSKEIYSDGKFLACLFYRRGGEGCFERDETCGCIQ